MIKLIALNQTGLFSFGYMPTLILDKRGVVFIQGINEDHNDSSNASGKSSFLNSIKEILCGENDTGKSGNHVINNHIEWKNGCLGALWLYDRNNVFWRIFMLNKWKGGIPEGFTMPWEFKLGLGGLSEVKQNGNQYTGSDIFLERWDGQIWVDERATSIGSKVRKDTRIKILNDVIGMTYEQFSAYVFLGQKAESALVHGTSGSREKIVQAVADVSIWDKAAKVVNTTYTPKENEIKTLESKISGLQSAINTFTIPSNEEIQQMRDNIQSMIDHIEQNTIQLLELNTNLNNSNIKIKETVESNADVQQEIDILTAEERHAVERYGKHEDPERPKKIGELDTEITKLDLIITQNANKMEKYDDLDEGDCPTCDQKITAEHLLTEIGRLEKENVSLEKQINDCRNEFTNLNQEHLTNVTSARKESKDAYDLSVISINKRKGELQIKLIDISVLRLSQTDITNKQSFIKTDNINTQSQITSTQLSIDSMVARQQEYEQSKQLLYTETDRLSNLNIEIAHLKWVERNLKKFKLHEYESAITRLNELIKIEMSMLWGPGMSARFTTAAEKAKGGIKQELNLLIQTANKPSVPIEMHSGGELKTIVISVFKAMRKLANERGVGVNISAIDEIDKDLDDYNTDALVDAFSSIAEDSSSCFVISHNSRLLNTMRFDEIWVVRKKNEFAKIELTQC
ncbi:hypothetical protein LCGC14_1340450 [marine sediment metagenome]|uniref:Rad50/SbcC-type AAA domain-containing protein n=1 Tax=marine sediment metagenome TaxID=412755 RepID=A0A0F9MUT3_9ZZZZ